MSDEIKHYRVSRQLYTKRFFDANNPEDLKLAYDFIKTGKWTNGCPFVEDWPYTNVPDMIKTEVILKHLPAIIKQKRKAKKAK
jgi:hypothetical protein